MAVLAKNGVLLCAFLTEVDFRVLKGNAVGTRIKYKSQGHIYQPYPGIGDGRYFNGISTAFHYPLKR